MVKSLTLIVAAFSMVSAFAAPSKAPKSEPVAPGFINWQIPGPQDPKRRQITPSDLRHRYTVVIEFQGEKAFEQLALAGLALQSLPAPTGGITHQVANWYNFKYPRDVIAVFSNRGGKIPADQMAKLMTEKMELTKYPGLQNFRQTNIPLVDGLGFEGSPSAEGKYPFVYIMGPEGKEPVYKAAIASQKDVYAMAQEFKKIREKAPISWNRFTGTLTETKTFKAQLDKAIAAGKGFATLMPVLKKGIVAKNEETAKEAQMIYDAIMQDCSDLAARINYEYHAAPIASLVDGKVFTKLYPKEKKLVETVLSKASAVPEYTELADVYEKIDMWESPDFLCKNAGEAKKNVATLEKFKKRLAQMLEDTNTPGKQKHYSTLVQNCIFQLQSRVDELISLMPGKVK